jgi:hypothetical protein
MKGKGLELNEMERSSPADNVMLKTETYELPNNADCRRVAPQLPTGLPLQSLYPTCMSRWQVGILTAPLSHVAIFEEIVSLLGLSLERQS